MPERPINLDIRTSSGATQNERFGSSSSGLSREAPDGDDVARFANSLRNGTAAAPGRAAMVGGTSAQVSGPLGLFGINAPSDPADSITPRADRSTDEPIIVDFYSNVKRLLVSEDQRSLRLDLDATAFPGVVVRVFEDAGAWVAEFSCSELASFKKLAEPAQDLATRMAQALSRDSVWRVLPVGLESDRVEDAVEAFASAPGGLR